MPKKKTELAPAEQSERFKNLVTDLEAAGELNLTDADAAFERLIDVALPAKKRKPAPS